MPQQHKRKPGSRTYKDYTEEVLLQALDECRHDNTRDVAKRHKIPYRTLYYKMKGSHYKPCGRPTVLSFDEEEELANHFIACAEYGMPLDKTDVRVMVSFYLKNIGRTVPMFKDNIPGPDWVASFIKRHVILSDRMCQNIKRSHAGVKPEDINAYFNRLHISLDGVSPSNILNFDETNLADDPGFKKCLFRRGVKYPERIINHSKGNITIMFAGTAEGEILPPYIVYKSQHLWASWCEGGPKDARYNRSRSGWMDSDNFDEWFHSVVVPWARRKEEKKVVIGDNLSSHLSSKVLKTCAEKNIAFVLLPPNCTDKCQPLDVSFFGPMKRHWRQIMEEYKLKSPTATSLNKDKFPKLLSKLMEKVDMHGADNLKAGFRACGICPVDRDVVLKKFPDFTTCNTPEPEAAVTPPSRSISPALLEYLQTFKYTPGQRQQRSSSTRKRLNVEPGKSNSANEIPVATTSAGTTISPAPSCSRTGPLCDIEEGQESSHSELDSDNQLFEFESSEDEWHPPTKRNKV